MLSPERKGRLTASMHGQALGYGYDSPAKTWRIWHGVEDFDERSKFHMERGNAHEGDALSAFEAALGVVLDRTGDDQLWTPYEDWSGCTTDGLIDEHGLVDAKCPHEMYQEPPPMYYCQLQSSMHITKRETAYLAAWTPSDLCIWETKKWPEYWTTVEPHLRKFWEMLRSTEPPGRTKKLKLGLPITWTKIR